jgi:hypothetical protein
MFTRCALLAGLLGALAVAHAAPAAPTPPTQIVIRGASLVLKVPNYDAARARVLALAAGHDAALAASRTVVNAVGRKHGELTLQVR